MPRRTGALRAAETRDRRKRTTWTYTERIALDRPYDRTLPSKTASRACDELRDFGSL